MNGENSPPVWATPGGRIGWLLGHRYAGSRSAMAKATGVSLTGLIKVVTGQQTPGRRLLETIARNTDVSPAWLFAGEGPPFKGSAVPVAAACLPGPPADHPDLLSGTGVPEVGALYSPTRYWLALGGADPAVRAAGTRLAAGDLMLMETDRGEFPPADRLGDRWAIVRFPSRAVPGVRLARLEYTAGGEEDGPAGLMADTYDAHPAAVRRVTLDLYPSGEIELSEGKVYLDPAGGVGPGSKPWTSSILPRRVGYGDVVAVCLLVVRRFG